MVTWFPLQELSTVVAKKTSSPSGFSLLKTSSRCFILVPEPQVLEQSLIGFQADQAQ